MANPITTSIVINFDSGDSGAILKAEIDGRPSSEGGFNDGITSFLPGDNPVFLLYKSSNVVLNTRIVSEGALLTVGNPTVKHVEQLQYAQEKSASLSYPPISGVTVLRASPGMPSGVLAGNEYNLSAPAVGIIEVEYLTRPEAIRVNGASGSLPVVVYIEGVAS